MQISCHFASDFFEKRLHYCTIFALLKSCAVSLTCITCKLFEHIVCRHILDHVEDHKILTNLQHGFRSGRSCEAQLITTTHDLLSSFNSKFQIDFVILDFTKAFDTVGLPVYS